MVILNVGILQHACSEYYIEGAGSKLDIAHGDIISTQNIQHIQQQDQIKALGNLKHIPVYFDSGFMAVWI